MALNKTKLKAVLALYSILLTQGLGEAEIKTEISKNPENFTPEEIEEIYSALTSSKSDPKPKSDPKYLVSAPFRDINDFNKKWKVGDDVSGFDRKRLSELLQNGLVEEIEE